METKVSLELLSRKQLADKLKINPRTLDDWRASGKIPFIRIGGILRFDWVRVREALDAFEVKEASRG